MIDFLIVTTDPKQLSAVEAKVTRTPHALAVVSNDRFKLSEPIQFTSVKDGKEHTHSIVLGLIQAGGAANVAVDVSSMISAVKPRAVLFVGLAAGIKGKVRVGDVVVPNRVSEISPSMSFDGVSLESRPYQIGSSNRIKHSNLNWKNLLDTSVSHQSKVKVHFEPTVSTSFVELKNFDLINKVDSNICAIDMEAAGFAAALQVADKPVDFAAILGISDMSDRSKSAGDPTSVRDTAAAIALAVAQSTGIAKD